MNEHNPFAAPSVQDDVARPHDPDSRVDFASLRTTGNGLTMIYVAILLQVLLGFAGAGFGILATRNGAAATLGMFMMALNIVGFLIALLKLVGMFFCATVPSESGAKGWIISSVVIQLAGLAFLYPGQFGGGIPVTNWIFTFVTPMIATVLFMIFLQKLGIHLQRPDMTKRARRVLILILIGTVSGALVVVGGIVPQFGARGPGGFMGNDFRILLLVVFAAIYALVVFVMYANVINAFGKYIRNPHAVAPRNHLG